MASDARYRLVYEESIRAVDDQQTALDELRSRTGILLSAASISTSFFGGLSLKAHNIGPFGWFAMAAFVGLALSVCVILFSTRWTFQADVDELLTDYVEGDPPADLTEIHRSLSFYRQRLFDENAVRLGHLLLSFRIATILLVLEVVAWLVNFVRS
jgi:hypothetical protein